MLCKFNKFINTVDIIGDRFLTLFRIFSSVTKSDCSNCLGDASIRVAASTSNPIQFEMNVKLSFFS